MTDSIRAATTLKSRPANSMSRTVHDDNFGSTPCRVTLGSHVFLHFIYRGDVKGVCAVMNQYQLLMSISSFHVDSCSHSSQLLRNFRKGWPF